MSAPPSPYTEWQTSRAVILVEIIDRSGDLGTGKGMQLVEVDESIIAVVVVYT